MDTTQKKVNRTGVAYSLGLFEKQLRQAQRTPPTLEKNGASIQTIWQQYYSNDMDVGTVPVPEQLGEAAAVLIDKLGECLAAERTLVRLYEILSSKLELRGGDSTLIDLLEQVRKRGIKHIQNLTECFDSLGADATAMTPSADTMTLQLNGVFKVISDATTSLSHCLCAILTAELATHESWRLLIVLIESAGLNERASFFRGALRDHQEHIHHFRGLYESFVLRSVLPKKESS